MRSLSGLGRDRRVRIRLSYVGVAATVLGLHALGFILLFTVAPIAGTTSLSAGLGLTAYALGLRHAFDADHIAAIDNTTRKLTSEGGTSISVGFWFSLGHSTVVLGLVALLAVGVAALAEPLRDDTSSLQQTTEVIGTTVSGVFLYAIAGINIVLLASTWKAYRRAERGLDDDDRRDGAVGGAMTKIFGHVMGTIRAPWQMYPLGLLFGLGFDTATEIGLLVLAATSAASGLPWYSLLALPILFAAGMSLLDTADGVAMRYAYGWAFAEPARKLRYNLTITGISVVVALVVGTIELLALLGDRLRLPDEMWQWTSLIDLNTVGIVIVGLLIAIWIIAVALWRWRRMHTATPT
jgi:high-affinity nickel-transport protein